MARNKVPENMTLEEAAEFWDKHSFLDYDDVKEVQFSVDLRKNKNYVVIKDDLAKQVRIMARQRGMSPSDLINQWIKEKVTTE